MSRTPMLLKEALLLAKRVVYIPYHPSFMMRVVESAGIFQLRTTFPQYGLYDEYSSSGLDSLEEQAQQFAEQFDQEYTASAWLITEVVWGTERRANEQVVYNLMLIDNQKKVIEIIHLQVQKC